jgi:hypothetical protein
VRFQTASSNPDSKLLQKFLGMTFRKKHSRRHPGKLHFGV